MQRLTREKLTPVFDRRLPPGPTSSSWRRYSLVETEDSRGVAGPRSRAYDSRVSPGDAEAGIHGNPVTGPIFIEGAEPGDTLAVRILEQKCDTLGYMGYWPFLFHLEDYFAQPATTLVEIRDGYVIFADDIRIPVRPVIGTIGVAPGLEAISSGRMGRHCGNVDVQEIAAGSTIFLPVYVEGALLCLGDCHAIQSDGEIGSVERFEAKSHCNVR